MGVLRYFLVGGILSFSLLVFGQSSQAVKDFAEGKQAMILNMDNSFQESLAKNVISKAKNLDEGKSLLLRFFHFSKKKTVLEGDLRKTLLFLSQQLEKEGLSSVVEIEFSVIDETNVKGKLDDIVGAAPSEKKIEKYLLEYEKGKEIKIGKEGLGRIANFFSVKKIKERFNKVMRKVFGAPRGITLLDHIFVKKNGKKTLRYAQKGDHSLRLAAVTSLLATSSFTLGVAPSDEMVSIVSSILGKPLANWGVVDFGSSGHKVASLVLGAWVAASMYFVKEVVSVKAQGKTALVNIAKEKGKHLKINMNKAFYITSSFGMELVLNTLIMASLVGFNNLAHGGVSMWLGVIGANALLSALSYTPAESYANKLFSESASLIDEAAIARKSGDIETAKELESLARSRQKKASNFLWAWWNVVYPTAKWSGFILSQSLLAVGGGEGAQLGAWLTANSGLLAFASFGIISDFYKYRKMIADYFKVELSRLRRLDKSKRWCPTYVEVIEKRGISP